MTNPHFSLILSVAGLFHGMRTILIWKAFSWSTENTRKSVFLILIADPIRKWYPGSLQTSFLYFFGSRTQFNEKIKLGKDKLLTFFQNFLQRINGSNGSMLFLNNTRVRAVASQRKFEANYVSFGVLEVLFNPQKKEFSMTMAIQMLGSELVAKKHCGYFCCCILIHI